MALKVDEIHSTSSYSGLYTFLACYSENTLVHHVHISPRNFQFAHFSLHASLYAHRTTRQQ